MILNLISQTHRLFFLVLESRRISDGKLHDQATLLNLKDSCLLDRLCCLLYSSFAAASYDWYSLPYHHHHHLHLQVKSHLFPNLLST